MTLNDLKQNIASVIAKMKANLTGKGVAVDESDTLHTLADKVNDITSDIPLNFDDIGYSQEDVTTAIATLNGAINYSQRIIYGKWNPNHSSGTTMLNKYKDNKYIMFAPLLDTSKVTTMKSAFEACSALIWVPTYDTSNVTTMNNIFWGCSNLRYIPKWDYSKLEATQNLFRGTALTSYIEHTIDVSNSKDISGMLAQMNMDQIDMTDNKYVKVTIIGDKIENYGSLLYYCGSVQHLVLDFTSVNTNDGSITFGGGNTLRILEAKNFGKSTCQNYKFNDCNYLGIDTPGTGTKAKDAFIKSFVTDSYDRILNSLPSVTITFTDATKVLFTEEELNIMTNKGYTIA